MKLQLTDTIIEVEKGCWCSGSLGLWWLLENVGSLLAESDKKEVGSWGGSREEFRLAELSRWIVASEWILWKCAGYLYPDGHVSFRFRMGANKIIRWMNREQVSWLCRGDEEIWQRQVRNCLRIILVEEMRRFGKDKFRNCLRIIFVEEMRRFGKDKFRNCLRIILVQWIKRFGKDKFRNCLRIILVEWMKRFGKDKFRNCLRIIQVEWMKRFGKDKFRNCLRRILWWAF